MNSYEKIGWLDHVEDVATGEVIQEGTPVSQTNMNHMDEGIYQNREAVILHEAQIADAQKEIKVLKDATPNAIKPQRMPCAMAEGILAGRLAKFREAK